MKEDGKEDIGKRDKVKTARESTRRLLKKPARKETSLLQTKTARERTQAPLKVEAVRRRGGEFEKSGRKRSGRRGRKEKEEGQSST